MDPRGKVALITGAARVGSVVAEALAGRGARVALTYRRSRRAAEETVARIAAAGGEARAFQGDLAAPVDAARMIEATIHALGGLQILVNMASMYQARKFETLEAEAFDAHLAADARSGFLTAMAAAPHMRRAGGGRIINFADWLAASGRPRYREFLPYYTAKRAVLGLTEALALELAPEILVNTIAPGPILPPAEMTPEEIRQVERATPLGRWGGPEEIAKAVLFLVETDFITGECIRVDGGRHLR